MSLSGQLESQNIGGAGGWGGGGFGGGGFGAFGLVGLLGLDGIRGRRDDGGGETPCAQAIFAATTLSKLGSIEAAIPLAAAQMANVVLEQTNDLNQIANQNNISQLQASAAVKDTVQNSLLASLSAGAAQTQSILQAVGALGSKIDQNLIQDLERQLADVRFSGRSKDVEVNVTQSVTQAQAQIQAQAQQQQQFSALISAFSHLAGDIQAVKQGQTIFNSGTMAASGTQAAANTKVN